MCTITIVSNSFWFIRLKLWEMWSLSHFSPMMLSLCVRCTFWVLMLVVTSVLAARMSGDDHLCPLVCIVQCWYIVSPTPSLSRSGFGNLYESVKQYRGLSLRLVLLAVNVVQDIYCKFSRYPWSLNVCTKFDNVFYLMKSFGNVFISWLWI